MWETQSNGNRDGVDRRHYVGLFRRHGQLSLYTAGSRTASGAARLAISGLVTVLYLCFEPGADRSISSGTGVSESRKCFSFIGMLPCQLVYFIAVQVSNPSTATVLQSSAPVLILLFYMVVDHGFLPG